MKEIYIQNAEQYIFTKHNFSDTNKDQEIIFFIHGYPDSHSTWFNQMYDLEKTFRIIAIDMRGAGHSTKPKNQNAYNMDEIFPDIEAVIQQLSPDKKVHIVAHDWGASICWVYCTIPRYVKNIKSFTAISGPHPTLAKEKLISMIKTMDIFNLLRALNQLMKSWYIFFFQFPALPELFWKLDPESRWKMFMEFGHVPKEHSFFSKSKEEISESVILPINLYRELIFGREIGKVNKILIPVQIIVPEKDLAINPEIYENAKDYVVNLSTVLMNANHWVHLEKPKEVSLLISDFVNKNKYKSND